MARKPTIEEVVLDENQLKYELSLWRPNHPIKRQVMMDDSFLDILCTGLGAGKCCPGDTLILTPIGLIKIEDIVCPKKNCQTKITESFIEDEEDIDQTKDINNVISISNRLKYDKFPISAKYDMGESDVFSIKTSIGYNISGTPEHKIVVIDKEGNLKFKKLEAISQGDHVAICVGTNIFNDKLELDFIRKRRTFAIYSLKNIEYMNEYIARLLGYCIAEANDNINDADNSASVCITNYDDEILNDVIKICKELNLEPKYRYDERNISRDDKISGILINSVEFRDFIYYLGYKHGSKNKDIPWSILRADKQSQIAFLRSMFDSDGTVHQETQIEIRDNASNGKEKSKEIVEYYSSSYEMCRQMQVMLLNFGIIARLHEKKGAINKYRGELIEYDTSWRLTITGGDILKYADIIGFGLTRKQDILNKCVDELNKRDRWTNITYSNIEKKINVLYQKLVDAGKKGKIIKRWQEDFDINGKTIKITRQKIMSHYEYLESLGFRKAMQDYAKGNIHPSKITLDKILRILELGIEKSDEEYQTYIYLKTINDTFIFDQVEEIKKERKRVYDITIDDVHSYIGNGIINHNTAIAERKALLYAMKHPGARLVLASPSYKQVEITIINIFKEICPPSLWNYCMTNTDEDGFKLYNATKKTLKLPNGSEFYFMSSDNYEAFRGTQFAFGFLDELRDIPSKEAFYVLQARLRQPGYKPHMIVATTPSMAKLKWLYNEYIVQKNKDGTTTQVPSGIQQKKTTTDIKGISYSTTYTVFSGLTAKDNPVYGYDYFGTQLVNYSGYSDAWVRQELYGEWIEFAGTCYQNMRDSMLIDMFDYSNMTNYDVNIAETRKTDIKIKNMKGGIKNIVYGVDWGKTVRMLVMITDEEGKIFIIEEKVIINADLDKIYMGCSDFENRYGSGIWVCDPSDPTRLQDLINGGFNTFGADRVDVTNRINDVNGRFGSSKLFIERRKCMECVRELQNLTWTDNEKKGVTIGPDHFSDIIGYVDRYFNTMSIPFAYVYGTYY